MIRLVIFDIAGTTVKDPDGVGGCLKQALDNAGVPWTEPEVNAIMGTPKPVAIAELMELAGEAPDPARVDAIHEDFRARMIEYYRSDPAVEPYEDTVSTIEALRARGIKVALDTGFDRPIVDVLMERLGWSDEFLDATATSDEVAKGRPYPDLVYLLMERTGVTDPKEVAKVGDTPSDLGEGTSAGCGLVIGVTAGTHTEAELAVHPHTHLVPSLTHVLALV